MEVPYSQIVFNQLGFKGATTLSITTLSIRDSQHKRHCSAITLSVVVMLIDVFDLLLYYYAECHDAECRYAD